MSKRKNGEEEVEDALHEQRTKRFLQSVAGSSSVVGDEDPEITATVEEKKDGAVEQEPDSTAKVKTDEVSQRPPEESGIAEVLEEAKALEGKEEKTSEDIGQPEQGDCDGGAKAEENAHSSAASFADNLATFVIQDLHRKVEKGDSRDDINREATQGVAFPERLYDLLNQEVIKDTLFWHDDGRKFVIDALTAQEQLLDKFFQRSKFASFARKLKRWGFKRCANIGQPNHYLYEHICFKKDCKELLKDISDKKKISDLAPPAAVADKKASAAVVPPRQLKADPEGHKPEAESGGDEPEPASPSSRKSLVPQMPMDPRIMQQSLFMWQQQQMQQMNPMFAMGGFPAMMAQQQHHHRLMMAGMVPPAAGPFLGMPGGGAGPVAMGLGQQQQQQGGDEASIRRFLLLEQLQKSNRSNQPRRF